MQVQNIEKNMGLADKLIRTAASVILIELVTSKKVPASIRGGLLMLSGLFLSTSLMGSCPAYSVMGISTKKNVNYAKHKRVF
ncbi:MAG: DUF2892 domain-containing protein [Ginsengibacter sp.]